MKASNKANMDFIKHVSGLGILIGVSFLWQKTSAQNSTHCVTGTTHCSWEDWGTWSACSKTCGAGTRSRQRGLCCTLKQTFEQCVTSCCLKDSESLETKTCLFVCPAGNCTYEKILNTGIEATDYKTLIGADRKITNAPLHLITPTEKFCKVSCENVNFNNGYFCWAYTWNTVTKCYLHFYKGPFVVARPELKGNHTGDSINIRTCTESKTCPGLNDDPICSKVGDSVCTGNMTQFGATRCPNMCNTCDAAVALANATTQNVSYPTVGDAFGSSVSNKHECSKQWSTEMLTASIVPGVVLLVIIAVMSGVIIKRKYRNGKKVAPTGTELHKKLVF